MLHSPSAGSLASKSGEISFAIFTYASTACSRRCASCSPLLVVICISMAICCSRLDRWYRESPRHCDGRKQGLCRASDQARAEPVCREDASGGAHGWLIESLG